MIMSLNIQKIKPNNYIKRMLQADEQTQNAMPIKLKSTPPFEGCTI
jgi:hypothetical protein